MNERYLLLISHWLVCGIVQQITILSILFLLIKCPKGTSCNSLGTWYVFHLFHCFLPPSEPKAVPPRKMMGRKLIRWWTRTPRQQIETNIQQHKSTIEHILQNLSSIMTKAHAHTVGIRVAIFQILCFDILILWSGKQTDKGGTWHHQPTSIAHFGWDGWPSLKVNAL